MHVLELVGFGERQPATNLVAGLFYAHLESVKTAKVPMQVKHFGSDNKYKPWDRDTLSRGTLEIHWYRGLSRMISSSGRICL